MDNDRLEYYWCSIPNGKDNAVTYPDLCAAWKTESRSVRRILHDLSLYDNGDDYILIRSGKSKGFYKTNDTAEIVAYRRECLNKGKSVFAPVKKCNRVLNVDSQQLQIFNNMRVRREAAGLKQSTVCRIMRKQDRTIDCSMLSKMENGFCLPTPKQLAVLAKIYGCDATELVRVDLYP